MSGLFQRVAQWLANEILVERLAKSKTMQNMAMKSVRTTEKVANAAARSKEAVGTSKKELNRSVTGFWAEMKEEIKKDLNKGL